MSEDYGTVKNTVWDYDDPGDNWYTSTTTTADVEIRSPVIPEFELDPDAIETLEDYKAVMKILLLSLNIKLTEEATKGVEKFFKVSVQGKKAHEAARLKKAGFRCE